MNSTAPTAAALSAGPRYNTNVSIQEIDNGFVLNWYDSKPNNVFCATLDEVRSKLESIFVK